MRLDVIDYFNSELETLMPDRLSKERISTLRQDMLQLRDSLTPKGANNQFTKAQITEIGREVNMVLTRALKADS